MYCAFCKSTCSFNILNIQNPVCKNMWAVLFLHCKSTSHYPCLSTQQGAVFIIEIKSCIDFYHNKLMKFNKSFLSFIAILWFWDQSTTLYKCTLSKYSHCLAILLCWRINNDNNQLIYPSWVIAFSCQ